MQDVPQRLHFLEAPSGAKRDARQGVIGDRHRKSRGVPQDIVHVAEERATVDGARVIIDGADAAMDAVINPPG